MIKKTYIQNIAKCAMAAVAAVSVASCSDSYPGLEYSGNNSVIPNEEAYDKTPIMVFINPQNFFSVTATRSGGTGPFTDLSNKKYENSTFYVFAFRGTEEISGPLAGKNIDLSKTRFFGAASDDPDPDASYCLVEGVDDYNYGFPAKLTKDYPGAFEFIRDEDGNVVSGKGDLSGTGSLFYSSSYQEAGYNFFAYHIDNLDQTAKPSRKEKEISYELTIDGTQDVMCGYAPALTGAVLDGDNNISNMTKEERDKVLNIGLYSTFAAHRGVNPVVNLEHQFVRLDFKAYPGDEEVERITITGVDVEAPNKGTLVVANANPHVANADYSSIGYHPDYKSMTYISLKGEAVDGEECGEFECVDGIGWWKEAYKGMAYSERECKPVGGSIMIPEQETYNIRLHFNQKDKDGNDLGDFHANYNVKLSNGSFQKGYNYTISIVVYGLKPIAVTANIENWIPSDDDIIVNEDKDPSDVDISND